MDEDISRNTLDTVCTLATPLLRQLTDHQYLDSLTHQWLP
jgi:hypothetical protein